MHIISWTACLQGVKSWGVSGGRQQKARAEYRDVEVIEYQKDSPFGCMEVIVHHLLVSAAAGMMSAASN